MTKELRVLRTSEWDRWYEAFLLAFGGAGESAEEQALWAGLAEHDRFIGVWDGDECVGTAGAFSFRVTVPGGASVPAAACDHGERGGDAPAAGRAHVDDA